MSGSIFAEGVDPPPSAVSAAKRPGAFSVKVANLNLSESKNSKSESVYKQKIQESCSNIFPMSFRILLSENSLYCVLYGQCQD